MCACVFEGQLCVCVYLLETTTEPKDGFPQNSTCAPTSTPKPEPICYGCTEQVYACQQHWVRITLHNYLRSRLHARGGVGDECMVMQGVVEREGQVRFSGDAQLHAYGSGSPLTLFTIVLITPPMNQRAAHPIRPQLLAMNRLCIVFACEEFF